MRLSERFGLVVSNWLAIMRLNKALLWFSNFYSQLAVIFPFVVAASRYFSGAIKLGTLIQISNAFGTVQDALSWFINSYTDIASWRASVDRLTSFDQAIAEAVASGEGGIHVAPGAQEFSLYRAHHAENARWPAAGDRGCKDRRRRACPRRRPFGQRQEHAVSRHRRHLALWRRRDHPAATAAPAVPAAEALCADRQPAQCGDLPGQARRLLAIPRSSKR